MGFGTQGSGHYIDPVKEPISYFFALIERAPIILQGKWGIVPAQIYGFLPTQIAKVFWVATVIFLLILGVILLPLLRNSSNAKFWFFGMVFSIIPICSTSPDDRLLFFVGIGAAALMAKMVAALMTKAEWIPGSKLWRIPAFCLIGYLVIFHLFISAFRLPGKSSNLVRFCDLLINTPAKTLPIDNRSVVKDVQFNTNLKIIDQDVVLINPPIAFMALQIPTIRRSEGLPVFRHSRVLASGIVPLEIKRTTERTLEIEAKRGYFPIYLDQIYRGKKYPMKKGQVVELTGMIVEILSMTDDKRPKRVAFHFSVPLEDSSLHILQWKDGKFIRYKPPAIGKTDFMDAIKLN
jgi:hypothetical protein